MTEEWKPVVGYEGLYEVSSLGQVRSLNYNRTGKIRIMVPIMKRDYLAVHLSNGVPVTTPIHKIVARAFLGKCEQGIQVNHKSGVKTDNRAENLEYCTSSENRKHAFRMGLFSQTGSKNNSSKITEEDVVEIRRLRKLGYSGQKVAERFSISDSTVYLVDSGQRWGHVPLEGGAS